MLRVSTEKSIYKMLVLAFNPQVNYFEFRARPYTGSDYRLLVFVNFAFSNRGDLTIYAVLINLANKQNAMSTDKFKLVLYRDIMVTVKQKSQLPTFDTFGIWSWMHFQALSYAIFWDKIRPHSPG